MPYLRRSDLLHQLFLNEFMVGLGQESILMNFGPNEAYTCCRLTLIIDKSNQQFTAPSIPHLPKSFSHHLLHLLRLFSFAVYENNFQLKSIPFDLGFCSLDIANTFHGVKSFKWRREEKELAEVFYDI